MKKSAAVLCALMTFSAMAGISVGFTKKSKLDKKTQDLVVSEIKKQCPFLVQSDIVATPTSEVEKKGVITLKHNVQVPYSEDGETELTITIDAKKKITIKSDTDYCRK